MTVEPSTIRWTAHPARRRPAQALLVLVVVAMVSVFCGYAMGFPSLSFLFALILCSAISGFLLPTTYELGPDRIVVRHVGTQRARAFSAVRRIELSKQLALVSPYRKVSRMDRFRALVVRLDGAPQEARLRLLKLRQERDADA